MVIGEIIMEIHNGLPMFECLRERQPVKNYLFDMECLTHGTFKAEFVEYEDGSREQITYCPLCEQEKIEKEQKRLEKQIQEEKIQHCKFRTLILNFSYFRLVATE